jgi:hypothetical protein
MPVEPSRAGKRICMKCARPFLSPDVERIRRCNTCKKNEDTHQPRSARMSNVRSAIGQHLRDTS